MKYKVISFDIWGTLLKQNPLFIEQRTKLFAEVLQHGDLAYVKSIKDEVDTSLDKLAEETGEDYDFMDRITKMVEKSDKKPESNTEVFFEEYRKKLNDLFLQYPPSLLENEAIEVFKELKNRGVKIALVSNTGFLHADAMKPVLEKLGILNLVDCAIFSNEIGVSKPHKDIFSEMIMQSGCESFEIVHVGDSVKADYLGAWQQGISSLLYDPKNKHGNRMNSINSIREVLPILESDIQILQYTNLSLHLLHSEDGKILDEQGNSFDFVSYSKFKYGDGFTAKQYGHKLAQKFITAYPDLFVGSASEDLVITTSPYKAIVKGSSGIVKGFKNYINQYLFELQKHSIVDITILKKEMFQGDYGSFSDEQRKALMNKNDLYTMDGFIKGKKLILIDDARITGSHEANLATFFKNKQIKEAYFLYIADMEIEFAKKYPDIESKMNHGWVDSLEKVAEIMKSPDFILNARVCKYVLSKTDLAEVRTFLSGLDNHVLYDLYNGIVGDEYASMDLYKNTFEILKDELMKRNIIVQNNFKL